MKYLVTGCAGFIGSHLAEELLLSGAHVLGVDRLSDYYDPALKRANLTRLEAHSAFCYVEQDLCEGLPDLDSVDGILHLAAQPGVRPSWGREFDLYLRDNVSATQRVFEAAVEAGVRVVFASSSSVYGNAERFPTPESVAPLPVSPYGVTKLTCERLAYTYGVNRDLDWVALRYFTVYGPRQRPDMAFSQVTRSLRQGAPFRLLGDGSQVRDFTYVSDAVSATIVAMQCGARGACYNVGGGTQVSLRQAIAVFERVSGRPVSVEVQPAAAGDVRITGSDTTALRGLGWRPTVGIEEGIGRQIEFALEVAAAT